MTADQEIERLDELLKELHQERPHTFATLRITNTTFRACTQQRWKDRNWAVKDEEVAAILNGNDQDRTQALLSLLEPQYINKIEIVPGAGIMEIAVPEPATVDQI